MLIFQREGSLHFAACVDFLSVIKLPILFEQLAHAASS